jgi:membrane protease YdiL (CAAX protease family)
VGPATASPVPPTSASPSCAAACRALGRFIGWTIGLSLAFSLAAIPFLDMEWWRIARRCVSIAAAISLWICLRRHEGRGLAAYGLPAWSAGAGKREFLTGLAMGGGVLLALLAAELMLGLWHVAVTPDRARLWRVVLTFVPAALLVAVLEELVFRGYLLQHLMACSTRFAVILSSAIYSAVHLKNLAISPAGMRELTGLFIFGIILCISYLRTGRLWLAIGLHAVLAYGARVNKLLVQSSDPSLAWLIGTNRLVDGVVGWCALLALGGWLWHETRQRRGAHAD